MRWIRMMQMSHYSCVMHDASRLLTAPSIQVSRWNSIRRNVVISGRIHVQSNLPDESQVMHHNTFMSLGRFVELQIVCCHQDFQAELDGNVHIWHVLSILVLVPVVKILHDLL